MQEDEDDYGKPSKSQRKRDADALQELGTKLTELAPGAHIKGPAIIAEDDTTTVISPSFDATIDRFGYIELNRRNT